MKRVEILAVAILLVLFSGFSSLAETLTVHTGGQTLPGASGISVSIDIDDGSMVAGASFLLAYDTSRLTLTSASSSFFPTFTAQNISPGSIVVGSETYDRGLLQNSSVGGTALVAVRGSNGQAGPQTLFTLTFDLSPEAGGDFPINIMNLVVHNPAAGYSSPTVLPMLASIDSTTNPVSFPSIAPAVSAGLLSVADSDGDGVTDEEESGNGLNPNLADSDGDGLSDAAELSYWGTNWNQDLDLDGLINILDWDSDNDGFSDGAEISCNSNPSAPGSTPAIHIYEDAEDGVTAGWGIIAPSSQVASIDNEFDQGKQSRVIALTGDGTSDTFRLRKENGSNWQDSNTVLQWNMQYSKNFVVMAVVKTSDGSTRYLQYLPVDHDALGVPGSNTIKHGLGSHLLDGNWHSIVRDLDHDLKDAEPENGIVEVLQFRIKGTGRIDDILTAPELPIGLDTDGDTISDRDEINSYGSNPYSADSDNDGLADGKELDYWGSGWSQDIDTDGLINMLDSDADNDGYSDGEELSAGTDPGDSLSLPRVYEDGEDGNIDGWAVIDNDPPGAVIANVYDAGRQSRVIELTGDGANNTYRLFNADGTNWQDADNKAIQWSMQYAEDFTVVVVVKTSDGNRNLLYTPVDYDNLGTGTNIHHGLGEQMLDGNWHTLTRDLEHDLKEAQPDINLQKILLIRFMGSGRVDDIRAVPALPDTFDSDGDSIADRHEMYTYGTNPYVADSDGDGLLDADELIYWGGIWNLDMDLDGKINILDPDADNDSYLDGAEVSWGLDPDDSLSLPRVYEDAEDGNIGGWGVFDNDPPGAVIANIYDAMRQSRVIELTGDGANNAYRLRNTDGTYWQDADNKAILWSMQYTEDFTVIVVVKTSGGNRNLLYTSVDYDNLGTGMDIHHGVGEQIRDGNWHTLTRDLEHDLKEAQPDIDLQKILLIRFMGSGRVDDIFSVPGLFLN